MLRMIGGGTGGLGAHTTFPNWLFLILASPKVNIILTPRCLFTDGLVHLIANEPDGALNS